MAETTDKSATPIGVLIAINGPVVRARIHGSLDMMEQVEVGDGHLVGEVIRMTDDVATIQVYEDTSGVRPGEPVFGMGMPLSVELGPGLMGHIVDGIQRPLTELAALSGNFIARGVTAPALDRDALWAFEPAATVGDHIGPGSVLGHVQETSLVRHTIMAPPDARGALTWLTPAGEYTVTDTIARIESEQGARELTMRQRWPVRTPRPVARRLSPNEPLVTGQRVVDTLFPIAKGGTAALPGGFGAGKTVLQQALAKWSDADIVIYVGCGERGNEMTDVLREFPNLIDPESGKPLIERTILIANTSNMPMAAREASIYTGITLAEYYRDMGLNVAMMADSTSRWAEALREIAGRLEEMPAEEGFPAYLPSRLASFYERAGKVETLAGDVGSVTVIGAVSPPSGDFSEPVTQHTQRFTRVFWALDKSLAAARHFPSVNWLDSYSGYVADVSPWWIEHVSPTWERARNRVVDLLQTESSLQEIVKLVGPDTLPDAQRWVLYVARLIREALLQQNALDPVDSYTPPQKQVAILDLLLRVHQRGTEIIGLGAPAVRLQDDVAFWGELIRAKADIPNDDIAQFDSLAQRIMDELDAIAKDYVS